VTNVHDFVRLFVNDVHVGEAYSATPTFTAGVLNGGNKLSLLVQTLGLQNYGTFLEAYTRGLLGSVTVNGVDITTGSWNHTIGLRGESQQLWTVSGSSNVSWTSNQQSSAVGKPFVWWKTTFDLSQSTLNSGLPLALDLSTMHKGFIWINGNNLGRHWSSMIASGNCDQCDYKGAYGNDKCREGCGTPSQRWYHLPRDWLTPTNNLLVILEENGGDPTQIPILQRALNVMCGDVGEEYPEEDLTVNLMCADNQKISSIDFASFGTPQGVCRQFVKGSCHAANSTTVVSSFCLNQNSCAVPTNLATFGDPCPSETKRLAIQVTCA